ncbi:hypothetical protein KC887_07650 [Candidatus Kaiserbacteria bacterium]|nr:hypothetical protein [Candidatus Kaiserbacteria bacterium]
MILKMDMNDNGFKPGTTINTIAGAIKPMQSGDSIDIAVVFDFKGQVVPVERVRMFTNKIKAKTGQKLTSRVIDKSILRVWCL